MNRICICSVSFISLDDYECQSIRSGILTTREIYRVQIERRKAAREERQSRRVKGLFHSCFSPSLNFTFVKQMSFYVCLNSVFFSDRSKRKGSGNSTGQESFIYPMVWLWDLIIHWLGFVSIACDLPIIYGFCETHIRIMAVFFPYTTFYLLKKNLWKRLSETF